MTLYTRNGDAGETAVYGGKTTLKSDPRIEAYGVIDELSSYLGVVICHITKSADKNLLSDIQKDLYLLMGYLAGAPSLLSFIDDEILRFETIIDREDARLSPLTHFVLPQGSLPSCHLHVARTICRRAERGVVTILKKNNTSHKQIVKYLNRLSDLLFVLARKYNTKEVVITNL